MNPVWVAFVAACSAFVASLVGPFITLAISRRQFRANVISANREKWIGTLRETTAEFIALAAAAALHASRPGNTARGHAQLHADPTLMPRFERLVQVRWNLRLLLNPDEPHHLAVVQAVTATTEYLQKGAPEADAIVAHVNRVADATQVVIRDAWRRVKQGT